VRIILIALFILFQFVAVSDSPNCWRGITPLHSTCEDVKRILKVDKCILPSTEYTLPDFRVLVQFESTNCAREPRVWHVPKGTVTAITLTLRKEMRPSEFGLDLSKYERREDDEIIGVEHYYNREEGVTVDLYRGAIQHLFLYPRERDEKLRCAHKKPN
jgi:hypothetical protein